MNNAYYGTVFVPSLYLQNALLFIPFIIILLGMGVAIFGAMANGGAGSIVAAVRISGVISCSSLVLVAVLIYRSIWRK